MTVQQRERRAAQVRRRVVMMVAVAISAGVGVAAVEGTAGAESSPVEDNNLHTLARQLECPDGDLLVTRINEIDLRDNRPGRPDGATTPEGALGLVLMSSFDGLDKSAFKKVASSNKRAVLEYRKNDEKRFIASAEEIDGWVIRAFVACNSTLMEAR